ncbi:MAG: tRNA pseudouridine(38-40) synthase TruA [Gammaproteobacteria bacterium]
MPRFVLGIEYDGSGFFGWQRQHGQRTVQESLEAALSRIADEPVTVICAGRTDAGVHALEQVVHFDCRAERSLHAWLLGGNCNLPDDIRIVWARPAVDDFHARYSAIARFYRYIILNRSMKSALQRRQVTWWYNPLNETNMHRAAQYLLGDHDFSSFRAQGCQSKSPRRIVHFIDVYREGDKVIMDIAANAFVHHMVRNIAGVLMEIGMGKRETTWPLHLLAVKDRVQAGITAPPDGLYLGGVCYPEHYGIARHPVFGKLPSDARRFD